MMKKDSNEEIEKKIELANKVLKPLVFDKFNIPYEIRPEFSTYTDLWFLTIFIDIDVDRFIEFSPDFNQEYQNYIDEINYRIINTLKYVNLQDYYSGVVYGYYNDDKVDDIMDNLNNQLYKRLMDTYNITIKDIHDSGIFYNLDKNQDSFENIAIEFVGDNIGQVVTCDELEQIMEDIYYENNIETSYLNYICT